MDSSPLDEAPLSIASKMSHNLGILRKDECSRFVCSGFHSWKLLVFFSHLLPARAKIRYKSEGQKLQR
jgi:hypothetical protein